MSARRLCSLEGYMQWFVNSTRSAADAAYPSAIHLSATSDKEKNDNWPAKSHPQHRRFNLHDDNFFCTIEISSEPLTLTVSNLKKNTNSFSEYTWRIDVSVLGVLSERLGTFVSCFGLTYVAVIPTNLFISGRSFFSSRSTKTMG